jgi:hypothetical protein
VQTTSIDQAAQSVSLTTVLAHSSGEWIARTGRCAPSEMATRAGWALRSHTRGVMPCLRWLGSRARKTSMHRISEASRAPANGPCPKKTVQTWATPTERMWRSGPSPQTGSVGRRQSKSSTRRSQPLCATNSYRSW